MFAKEIVPELKLTAIASLGSVLAFGLSYLSIGLAYGGYSSMLFWMESWAYPLWFTSLALAVVFALALLGAVVLTVWQVIKRQTALITPLAPMVALSLVIVLWRWFVDYASHLP